jgi:AraC-like DNA-binding protein
MVSVAMSSSSLTGSSYRARGPDDPATPGVDCLSDPTSLIGAARRSSAAAAVTRRGGLSGWQIRRLKTYVENHLAESITVADMASLVRLSPHHFCRTFRISLHDTPHAYVMRMRIERSQTLMRTSVMQLGRVAVECGFADQAHFNRAFRKRLGVSPGAWRRAHVDHRNRVRSARDSSWQSQGLHRLVDQGCASATA